MFCDLVDSTKLSSQLDPEDLLAVVRSYQATCAQVIQRFDGYIAQYLGDGLLVYFGYPVAHEDDAQRAIHAGLGIIEAIKTLNTRLEQEAGIRLAIRLGSHTGLVVMGEMGRAGRHEQLALGETPNIAARIQGAAEPNRMVISDATYRLIQGYFDCDPLGEQMLRGVTAPVAVYRVLHESSAQSRLDIARARGLTPLVGREQEVRLLLERWEQSRAGHGQVVLLRGEAGIGKSRLVQVLKDHVADEPSTQLECRSSPYYQNTALYPITDLLPRVLNWKQDDTSDEKLTKLAQELSQYRLSLAETVALIAPLLSLPLPEDQYPPLNLSPQRQRQKTLEAIVAILLERAEQQPVLFILEDMHWTDPTTLELLDRLVDRTPTAALYVLLTYRPEFQSSWNSRPYLTEVTVNRLSSAQAEHVVERLTGTRRMPLEMLQRVVDKSDGVPLYVEEMTKAVLESGIIEEIDGQYALSGSISALSVPATLQDSLMARLDRLVTAKAIAQYASVIGRQFSYELLWAVSQVDEDALQKELSRLVEVELVYQQGIPPQATYTFKHTLIQDTAYQSLLRSTRQEYHRRIAQVLAEHSPDIAETQPELLAHHYTEAGFNAQAVPLWQRAGQHAIERSANLEAISHLTKGLELLKALPETPERIRQEIALQITLGAPLMATKGYAAREVENVFAQARELCRHLGETPQLFTALRGLRTFYQIRGDSLTAQELGEQLLRLARRVQDPALLLEAHYALGAAFFWMGDFAPAHEHFEQVLALYDPEQHRSHAYVYGNDPGVVGYSYTAWTLWYLGYPEQSVERLHKALALAYRLSHPFSLAFALAYAAALYCFRQEIQAAQEWADKAIALSHEHGFPFWLTMASMLRGWSLSEQGQTEEGLALLQQALEHWRAMGTELGQPQLLALLAQAYGHAGQIETGLVTLDQALEMLATYAERSYDTVDVYQTRGELLLQCSPERWAEAEACFRHVVEVARRQGSKSWELRAMLRLSYLLQRLGRAGETRQELAAIHDWFTEGFTTPDFQSARTFLEDQR